MIFADPVPFEEAIASRQVKAVLPTSLGSAELKQLGAAVRERAVFSARTENAGYLQRVNDLVTRIVSPESVRDPETGELRPARPGEYMDQPTARLELKRALQELEYMPDEADRGTIKDLSSDRRLNLVIETNVRQAQGYGSWRQAQEPSVLDEWPAQELFRAVEPKGGPDARRDWPGRWAAAGGKFFDGRMIALKNDPIWTEISEFDLPYPPFDYNSGMDVRDIDRAEAEDLGVIEPGAAAPAPEDRGFNDVLEMTPEARDEDLRAALLDSLGEGFELVDGVLRKAA